MSSKDKITLNVFRFDPKDDESGRYEKYEIRTDNSMSVLAALRYIYENIDPMVAFRNYECYLGICSSCLMRVNGKNVRACSTLLNPGDEVRIDPIKSKKVIRDLVVDFES